MLRNLTPCRWPHAPCTWERGLKGGGGENQDMVKGLEGGVGGGGRGKTRMWGEGTGVERGALKCNRKGLKNCLYHQEEGPPPYNFV